MLCVYKYNLSFGVGRYIFGYFFIVGVRRIKDFMFIYVVIGFKEVVVLWLKVFFG